MCLGKGRPEYRILSSDRHIWNLIIRKCFRLVRLPLSSPTDRADSPPLFLCATLGFMSASWCNSRIPKHWSIYKFSLPCFGVCFSEFSLLLRSSLSLGRTVFMISWSVWKFVLFFALVSNCEVVQVAIVLGGLLLFQGGPCLDRPKLWLSEKLFCYCKWWNLS